MYNLIYLYKKFKNYQTKIMLYKKIKGYLKKLSIKKYIYTHTHIYIYIYIYTHMKICRIILQMKKGDN